MTDHFHFPLDVVRAASERWEKSKGEAESAQKARAANRLDKIDTTERIAKHANRLRSQVMRQLRRHPEEFDALPRGARDLLEHGPVEPKDIKQPFLERVLGPTRDFLSVEFFELGARAIRAVARIVTQLDGRRFYGTGFMVSDQLMITNHHVLESVTWARASIAQFDYQRDRLGMPRALTAFGFDPARFFLADKTLDYALVAVRPEPDVGNLRLAEAGFCPLVGLEGKILVTDPVNIVQHPQGRLKEVVIRENRLSALPGPPDDAFAHYLADTEPGSSGSPVFNDRWEVIALHHASVPERDGAGNIKTVDGGIWNPSVPASEINWIGNEGIRISRIISHLRSSAANLAGEQRELLAMLLANAESDDPGPISHEEAAPAPVPSGGGVGAFPLPPSGGGSVSIPLTLTLTLGGAAAFAGVAGPDVAEGVRPDPDYRSRRGYDPDFLGVEVPMPWLADERHGQVAALSDGTEELRYHHYSVLMNAKRRLAYVSAVNYDAQAPFVHERGSDSWFLDPRLDRSLQADNRFYSNNPLDRGHLTRRLDAAWGHTPEEAKRGNDDTFHWTNCAPQHEVFNRSNLSQPKDLRLWGELENHVTAQARDGLKRLSVFNGPVFAAEDRTHRELPIPSAFWKIVAYRSKSGELRAIGFVLHQTDLIANLAAERFDVGRFDLRQVRISAIEELTGLDFGGLRNADPMASAQLAELFGEAMPTQRKLESAEDILF